MRCEICGHPIKKPRLSPDKIVKVRELIHKSNPDEVVKLTGLKLSTVEKIRDGVHPTQLRLQPIEPKKISSGRHLKVVYGGEVKFNRVDDKDDLAVESFGDYPLDMRVVKNIHGIMPEATKRVSLDDFAPDVLRWVYHGEKPVVFYLKEGRIYHILGENDMNYDMLRHRAGIVVSIMRSGERKLMEDYNLQAKLGFVFEKKLGA